MNNHYILHYVVEGTARPLPWPLDLTAKRVVSMRAGNLGEAVAISRAYAVMMILFDIESYDPHLLEAIRQIESVAPGRRPSMMALLRFDPTPAERHQLIEAGIDSILSATDPPRLLVGQLDILTQIRELEHFRETQMDVNRLAGQTREKLHDLSQPLSALQGRLQLLAARCDPEDPNAQCFKDLVRLIFDVSRHLMEVQKLHRIYS